MVPNKMDALEWLRKQLDADDSDLLREMVASFAERLMAAEVDVACNATYGEPTPERINSRNGYRSRPSTHLTEPTMEAGTMGQLYDYRGILPTVAATAVLFPSAEITGDVVIGERTIIGAGVKIIGDSHGPVRIGEDVQILENTVLHLLPDNDLVINDGATIGPGAMIHGCHIGPRTVVEPGAIVCDGSVIGADCTIGAGAVVKQRSRFPHRTHIDGFPAVAVAAIELPPRPCWALDPDQPPTAPS